MQPEVTPDAAPNVPPNVPRHVPTPRARRAGNAIAIVAAIVALAALATAAWWFDARSRPDAVGKRVADEIVARHAGASVASPDADTLRVTMPSGVYVDARLAPVFAACRDDRFRCSEAIDRALADIAHIDALRAAPILRSVRAMVVDEPSPGFRFGFVTEPLIGALEVRYALVSGVASTFVTQALAARLVPGGSAARPQLRRAALQNLAADGEPRLELLPNQPGVYRVISNDGAANDGAANDGAANDGAANDGAANARAAKGDAAAELLDASRMRKLAAIVGSARVYCAIPRRGALFLARADAAGKQALTTLPAGARTGSLPHALRGALRPALEREAPRAAQPRNAHIFIYDTQAPEGQALAEAGPGA